MSNQGNEVLGAHLGIDKSKSKNEKKSRIKVNLKKWFDDGNILPLSTIDNVLHEDDNDHDHNDDNDVNHDNDNDVNDVNHDNDNTKTKIEKEKEKEKSSNQIYLKKWTDNGNTIPICINQGCNNTVSIRHWSSQGDPSLKTECSRCADARKKNKEIPGVTFHKKKYCENKDGILGFICPMDKDRYAEFPSDIYHMDHIDGDHHNNELTNLKTFCAICHTRKGKESGDFNGFKKSSRIHKH